MPDTVSAGHADGMIGARTASDERARLSITPAQSPLPTFRSRRADVISDVALVAALLGGVAYLALGAPSMHPTVGNSSALSAIVALAAVLVLSGWCVLVLWVGSPLHYGLAATAWALALGAL